MDGNIIAHDFSQHQPTSQRIAWKKGDKLVLSAKDLAQIVEVYISNLYVFDGQTDIAILSGTDDDGQPVIVVQEPDPT